MDDAREAWEDLVQGAALEAGACSYCSEEEDMQFHGTDKHDPECPVPVVEAALDELDRLRARSRPMDDAKTVKVRIPVLVDRKGNWSANAWQGHEESDEEAMSELDWDDGSPKRLSWIVADVPLPETAPDNEVRGEVEPTDG